MLLKLSNIENTICLEISTQVLLRYNIDIHSLLTICEYPLSKSIKSLIQTTSSVDFSLYQIISIYFQNNIWTIYLESKNNFKPKKKIKKYSLTNIHTYTNQRICEERRNFICFYEYLNKSIYSKYVSIKNGIIFIKDKSKEKYILNYLSEFE